MRGEVYRDELSFALYEYPTRGRDPGPAGAAGPGDFLAGHRHCQCRRGTGTQWHRDVARELRLELAPGGVPYPTQWQIGAGLAARRPGGGARGTGVHTLAWTASGCPLARSRALACQ